MAKEVRRTAERPAQQVLQQSLKYRPPQPVRPNYARRRAGPAFEIVIWWAGVSQIACLQNQTVGLSQVARFEGVFVWRF
jgi:hypothetical protein